MWWRPVCTNTQTSSECTGCLPDIMCHWSTITSTWTKFSIKPYMTTEMAQILLGFVFLVFIVGGVFFFFFFFAWCCQTFILTVFSEKIVVVFFNSFNLILSVFSHVRQKNVTNWKHSKRSRSKRTKGWRKWRRTRKRNRRNLKGYQSLRCRVNTQVCLFYEYNQFYS